MSFRQPSTEEVYNDLKCVREELGYTPTATEYDEHGEFTYGTVERHTNANSWEEAVEEVFGDVDDLARPHVQITDKELIDDLKQTSESLDGKLTKTKYDEHGKYSPSPIQDRFGSWNEGLLEANLEVSNIGSRRSVTDDELLADLVTVADELGRRPSRTEYDEHGKYESHLFNRFEDTWTDLSQEAYWIADGRLFTDSE